MFPNVMKTTLCLWSKRVSENSLNGKQASSTLFSILEIRNMEVRTEQREIDNGFVIEY